LIFGICFFWVVTGDFHSQFTMSDDERDEKELDLTSPDVVTKYKSAAEIVNSMFHPYNFFFQVIFVVDFGYIWFIILSGFMLNPQPFS